MAAPCAALPSINDSWPNGLAATVFLQELMDGAQDGGRQTSVESLLIKHGGVGGESERPPPTAHERKEAGVGWEVVFGRGNRTEVLVFKILSLLDM